MERVTDEWLGAIWRDAHYAAMVAKDMAGGYDAIVCSAIAQAVARECIDVIMCFNNRDEGVRNIRARFGLEDE